MHWWLKTTRNNLVAIIKDVDARVPKADFDTESRAMRRLLSLDEVRPHQSWG